MRRSRFSPRPSPIRPMPTMPAATSAHLSGARAGVGGVSLQSRRVPGLRPFHLQPACRQQRHRLSSSRRPMLTMRPGFLTFNDARGSGLRHYPADTHLLAWLEAKKSPSTSSPTKTWTMKARVARALQGGADRIASGISHPRHARCPANLHRPRRPAGLSRRQRILLADRAAMRCRASSRSAAPRGASAPGTPNRANITTPSTGSSAACGGATAGHRRFSPVSAFPAKACSRGRIIAACRRPTRTSTPGSSRAWKSRPIGGYGFSGGGAAGFEIDRADFDLGTPAHRDPGKVGGPAPILRHSPGRAPVAYPTVTVKHRTN